MISAIHIEGFKSFSALNLPISPFTLLAGENGAGKTTLLHALVLLRETAATAAANSIDLNGFGLCLGEALDVLHANREAGEGIILGVTVDGVEQSYSYEVPTVRSQRLRVARRPSAASGALAAPPKYFTYLCADRLGPRDLLDAISVDEDNLNVGVRGEATGQVLAQLGGRPVSDSVVHPCTLEISARNTLLAQTELWLSEVVKPTQVNANWVEGSSATILRFRTPGRLTDWIRPVNAGFGLTVALPVIVAGLCMPPGGLLLVENPEAHLHPRGQSAIGSFLAKVAAGGVQVIVETHSDHVLNGLRRAVAVEQAIPATDVAVKVFREAVTEKLPRVDEVSVRSNGELSMWPDDFFDQIERDLATLAGARRRVP